MIEDHDHRNRKIFNSKKLKLKKLKSRQKLSSERLHSFLGRTDRQPRLYTSRREAKMGRVMWKTSERLSVSSGWGRGKLTQC